MKRILLAFALCASPALADTFGGSPPPTDLTAITTSVIPTVDNTSYMGSAAKRFKGAFLGTDGLLDDEGNSRVVFAADGTTTIKSDTTPTGGTDVGIILDNINDWGGSDKSVSLRDGNQEHWYMTGLGQLTGADGATTTTIASDTAATTTTASIASITLRPTVVLTANDLVLNVENSAGTNLFTVDQEGDGVIATLAAPVVKSDTIQDSGGNSRLNMTGSATTTLVGVVANGAGAIAIRSIPDTTYTTAGATIHDFHSGAAVVSRVDKDGFYIQPAQTVTIANDGAGSAPASTVTPTSKTIKLAYNDVTNASVGTISETGAQEGAEIRIFHTGSGGTVVFTEVAGQQEIGGTACTLGLSDVIEATYVNSSWHISACRDN